MAKVLNLDSLVTKSQGRELEVKGKRYAIPPMSVQAFIEINRASDKLRDSTDPIQQLEHTIDMILVSVPGLPREELTAYPLDILGSIAQFVGGEDVDAAAEQLDEAQAEAGK